MLTGNSMIVPKAHYLSYSNIWNPRCKPWHEELDHVIIHIQEVFIYHRIQLSPYGVLDMGVKLHPFAFSWMNLKGKN